VNRVEAPFTPEDVAALNRFQLDDRFHPFTCASVDHAGVRLIATENGWRCAVQTCGYTQDWAWDMMLTDVVRLRGRPELTVESLGLQFPPLPTGTQPVDGVILVRALKADGQLTWMFRFTPDCPPFESLTALELLASLEHDRLTSLFVQDSEEP